MSASDSITPDPLNSASSASGAGLPFGEAASAAAAPRKSNRTAAFLAAAALLLFPLAITLPFLRIERLGISTENSILSGLAVLFRSDQWLVGAVVLLCSLVIPPLKLATILVLAWAPPWLSPRQRTIAHQAVEHLGRWGMLDVLLVAVLVAFVKLGTLVEFVPRVGVAVFLAFVALSLWAGATFRPANLGDRIVNETTRLPQPKSGARRSYAAWAAAAIVTLALLAILGFWLTRSSGDLIAIRFQDGRGLQPGASLRYRGIVVGEVQSVALEDDTQAVEVRVRLAPKSQGLARHGSRFWIVRPRADLGGIEGLETLLGPKYLAVLPGPEESPVATRFVGLEEPPPDDLLWPGGMEVLLRARQSHRLRPGAPVLYRGLQVGSVARTSLATDGGSIETVLYIRREFQDLIRLGTKFWIARPLHWKTGLSGVSLNVGPLESFLLGGIEMAVPPEREVVPHGYAFPLEEEPKEAWLAWNPQRRPSEAHREFPRLLPAHASWRGRWWIRQRRDGWVLPVEGAVLGPSSLLLPTSGASAEIDVDLGNGSQPISGPAEVVADGIAKSPLQHGRKPWPPNRLDGGKFPCDCHLVTDGSTASTLFVSGSNFRREGDRWLVSSDLRLAEALRGAALVAADDGAVVGLLDFDQHQPIVRLVGTAAPGAR